MHTADALSRATYPNEVQSSIEEDVHVYVNMVTSNMPVSHRRDQKRVASNKGCLLHECPRVLEQPRRNVCNRRYHIQGK